MIAELLSLLNTETEGHTAASDAYLGRGCQYTKIIAIDILSCELIAETFEFHPNVIPIQLDLSKLTDPNSCEFISISKLLADYHVTTVIHIAAIVDTREHKPIRQLVKVL